MQLFYTYMMYHFNTCGMFQTEFYSNLHKNILKACHSFAEMLLYKNIYIGEKHSSVKVSLMRVLIESGNTRTLQLEKLLQN